MRTVIQRVKKASVSVSDKAIAEINRGLVVLVGINNEDTSADAKFLADKIPELRIFEDKQGKLNLSAKDLKLEVLVISNFTLYADCSSGRRPSFEKAASAERALDLYSEFIAKIKGSGLSIKEGKFKGKMLIHISNDGPVTLVLDSR